MLSDTPIERLGTLPEISKAGKRVNGLFRMMESQALWEMAYSRIAPNKGALTPGVDGQTFDGLSLEKVRSVIGRPMDGAYNPQPVRRVYVPKANGKTRPLGIPTTEDRMVQEVVGILLEAIYEPVFSEHSHGFRPGRSCHTALDHIRAVWTGMKWLADVDITGFFDNIDHDVLTGLLAKKIDDDRFIRLIRGMLKAGYIEDRVSHRTHSGTPQGGVVSPMLANAYLHELDLSMADRIRSFNKGKERAVTREAVRLTNKIARLRRKIDHRRTQAGEDVDVSGLQAEIRQLTQERLTLPSGEAFDPDFRRLRYCRYADDFLIGIIGSKQDARDIMAAVGSFSTSTLKLQTSAEKSGIREATDGARFLGYEVCTYTADRTRKHLMTTSGRGVIRRSPADVVQLKVPYERVVKFREKQGYGNLATGETIHRTPLLHASDVEIVAAYNAELRGFATYHVLAKDVKQKLRKLQFVWLVSLLKTLAAKHKSTVAKTAYVLRDGTEFSVHYENNGKPVKVTVWKLKDLRPRPDTGGTVDLPPFSKYGLSRTELVERLNAGQCEYCGQSDTPCEVHHVRKMADLKGTPLHRYLKAARLRKRIVLCRPCHVDLRAGRLPDLRYQQQVGVESRVR